MENDHPISDLQENVPPAAIDPTLPRIYSSNVILGFSIFFAAIFGGVLLGINLFRAGLKRAGFAVVSLSIVYEAVAIWLVNLPEKPISSMPWVFNVIGGVILAKGVFPRFFPDEKIYPKRKIWVALIVSILISVPLLLAAIGEM